jgi:hypothetical protein
MPGISAEFVSSSVKDGRTELRTHTEFFDRDNDGIIWPADTLVQIFHESGNWDAHLFLLAIVDSVHWDIVFFYRSSRC